MNTAFLSLEESNSEWSRCYPIRGYSFLDADMDQVYALIKATPNYFLPESFIANRWRSDYQYN